MSKRRKKLLALALAGVMSAGTCIPGTAVHMVQEVQAEEVSAEDEIIQYIRETLLEEEMKYIYVSGNVNPNLEKRIRACFSEAAQMNGYTGTLEKISHTMEAVDYFVLTFKKDGKTVEKDLPLYGKLITTNSLIGEFCYEKGLTGLEIPLTLDNPNQQSVAEAVLAYLTEKIGTADFDTALVEYVKQKYPQIDMESTYTFVSNTSKPGWNPEEFKKKVVYEEARGAYCELNICRNENLQEMGRTSIYFKVKKGSTNPSNKWVQKDGVWYYYDANGKLCTNRWIKSGSKWCYVDGNGKACAKKWAKIGTQWYYFGADTYMYANQWLKSGGKWYYFNGSGYMKTGWVKTGDKWYYMNGSGVMQTGWVKTGGKWYYMNGSGVMQTGWKKIGSKQYCFASNGAMYSNTYIGKYYVDQSGAWVPAKDKK